MLGRREEGGEGGVIPVLVGSAVAAALVAGTWIVNRLVDRWLSEDWLWSLSDE